MVSKIKQVTKGQRHIIVPDDMWERWNKHKKQKYDGLPAMSQMIREYVEEGIKRENATR